MKSFSTKLTTVVLGLLLGAAALRAAAVQAYDDALAQTSQLAKDGRLDEAMAAISRVAEIDPKRYETLALTTLILAQGGMLSEAYEALAAAWPLAPAEAKAKLEGIAALLDHLLDQKRKAEEERAATLQQRQAYYKLVELLVPARSATDIATHQLALRRFMDQSQVYLNTWENQGAGVWLLRVMAALELDLTDDGIIATRAWRQRQNPDDSDDFRIPQLYARAKKRGWPTAATQAEMTAQLQSGLKASAPVNTAWVNSLNMGFVSAGGVLFSVYETRVADYHAFVRATGRNWVWQSWQQPDHPAVNVTWAEATAFCQWLTAQERRLGLLRPNQSYRLPSDVEWSLASGAAIGKSGPEIGTTPDERYQYSATHFPECYEWGNQPEPPAGQPFLPPGKVANLADDSLAEIEPAARIIKGYDDGFARTAPVGSFRPNALGLFDLTGNAGEWVLEYYEKEKTHRVYRGADWNTPFMHAATAWIRTRMPSTGANRAVGFRCVIATDGN